jgi:putative two-component system response regulator
MLSTVESPTLNASKHPSASSILVVDDEHASGELAVTLLKSQGYDVRLVSDGKEALSRVARGEVDLLILDLMMSRMDGVEICAHVRNELRDWCLPIVITTSLNDRESRIRAKEAGADDVLVKPIDGLELLVRIDSLLRTRAQVALLLRERDRSSQDLHFARATLQNQQRTLRGVEAASETACALLEHQRRALEAAKKRWSHVPEAREEIARFVQLSEELRESVQGLTSADTGTLVRVADGAETATDLHDGRAPATAIK